MAGRLSNRVAIVTGAGRGIGRAEALLLAHEGAAVVVNDVDPVAEEVAQAIRDAGGRAVASHASVVTMEGGQAIVDLALASFGRLDVLVNNAGITRHAMFHEMTEAQWDEVIAVNLKGHFTVTRAAVPHFRAQRSGRIINTSSDAGLGSVGCVNYSASKEAVVGLTRSLALELRRSNVTVNAIRPWAATRLSVTDQLEWSVSVLSKLGKPELAQRLSGLHGFEPASVAALVGWLSTDDAAAVTGRTFLVAGPELALFSEPGAERTLTSTQPQWTLNELAGVMPSLIG